DTCLTCCHRLLTALTRSKARCSARHRRCARGDAMNIAAAKSNAIAVPEGTIKPCRQERVAHRGWCMSLEQRTSCRGCEQFDHRPRSRRVAHGFPKHDPPVVHHGLQSLLTAARRVDCGKHPLQCFGRAFDGAEKIETHNVSRSLPDGVYRGLAIEQWE